MSWFDDKWIRCGVFQTGSVNAPYTSFSWACVLIFCGTYYGTQIIIPSSVDKTIAYIRRGDRTGESIAWYEWTMITNE